MRFDKKNKHKLMTEMYEFKKQTRKIHLLINELSFIESIDISKAYTKSFETFNELHNSNLYEINSYNKLKIIYEKNLITEFEEHLNKIINNSDNSKNENAHIYFIYNDNTDFIKIGVSKNPNRRLKELQTSNSEKLTLLFTINNVDKSIEKTLHKYFNEYRYNGEWFYNCLAIQEFIETGKKCRQSKDVLKYLFI